MTAIPGMPVVAENLTVRIVDTDLEWLLLDDVSGIVRLRGQGDWGVFEDLIREFEWQGETRILIAGEKVLLTEANIPSQQQRQIQQALPFAVEEQLAVDVESCHFVQGERKPEGMLPVLVISRQYLRDVLDRFGSIGLSPEYVGVDLLQLVRPPAGINIMIDGQRAHLLTAELRGASTELQHLGFCFELIDDQENGPVSVTLHEHDRSVSERFVAEIEAGSSSPVTLSVLDAPPLETMCRGYRGTMNLLQGEFRVQKKRTSSEGWKVAAILTGGAILIHLMLSLGEGLFLSQRADGFRREAEAMYTTIFPNDRNVQDLRRRWIAHLGGDNSAEGSRFLSLFGQVASRLNGSKLVLQNVNFNESRGDLILQLIGPRSEQFVTYTQSLAEDGIVAEIGTISQSDDAVRGSIKIKAREHRE